jgi:glutamate racemase
VPLVEAGKLEGAETADVVGGYLRQLLAADAEIDTLLLGCTHYPLLRPVIERQVGPGVAVVDSAFTTALATEDLLDALDARSPADPTEPMMRGANRIATTGDVTAFSTVAERVFGARLPQVEAASVAPH